MDHEDELDRMRARKRRSGSNRTHRNSQKEEHTQSARSDRTYYSTGDGRNPRVKYSGKRVLITTRRKNDAIKNANS